VASLPLPEQDQKIGRLRVGSRSRVPACRLSYEEIARKSLIGRDSAIEAVKNLVKYGFLLKLGPKETGEICNVYRLLTPSDQPVIASDQVAASDSPSGSQRLPKSLLATTPVAGSTPLVAGSHT
jgi:hypothetical protein